MEEQSIKQKVEQLIARNKTEAAIKLLSSAQFSKADKQLIILNSRYNRIKDEQRLGILPREEGERKINEINIALLDLSQKIKSGKDGAILLDDLEKKPFNRNFFWLLLIPIALAAYFMSNRSDPSNSDGQTNNVASAEKADSMARVNAMEAELAQAIAARTADSIKIFESPNLVAHFPMDEGMFEANSKLEGEAISVQGCENRHQQRNKARIFNGRSRIAYDRAFLAANPDNLSIAFWIWPDHSSDGQAIIGQFTNIDIKYKGTNHYIAITGDALIGIDEYPSDHGYEGKEYQTSKESRNSLPRNQWSHVVIMRTPEGERIYVNGLKQTNSRDQEKFSNEWGKPVRTIIGARPRKVGANAEEFRDYFKGRLDDILFFNTALDDETIKFLASM